MRNSESAKVRNNEIAKVRNNERAKQRKCETAKVRNCETTKQRKSETAKVRNNETARLRNNEKAKQRKCESTKQRKCGTAKVWNNETAKVRNNERAKRRKYEIAKVRNNESAKQRKCETAKQQKCETTKVWCETTKMRNNETAKGRCETTKGRCETTKLRKSDAKQRKGAAKQRKGDAKQRKCETTKVRNNERARWPYPDTINISVLWQNKLKTMAHSGRRMSTEAGVIGVLFTTLAKQFWSLCYSVLCCEVVKKRVTVNNLIFLWPVPLKCVCRTFSNETQFTYIINHELDAWDLCFLKTQSTESSSGFSNDTDWFASWSRINHWMVFENLSCWNSYFSLNPVVPAVLKHDSRLDVGLSTSSFVHLWTAFTVLHTNVNNVELTWVHRLRTSHQLLDDSTFEEAFEEVDETRS